MSCQSPITGSAPPSATLNPNDTGFYYDTEADELWFRNSPDGMWMAIGGGGEQEAPLTGTGAPPRSLVPNNANLYFATDTHLFYFFDRTENTPAWVEINPLDTVQISQGSPQGRILISRRQFYIDAGAGALWFGVSVGTRNTWVQLLSAPPDPPSKNLGYLRHSTSSPAQRALTLTNNHVGFFVDYSVAVGFESQKIVNLNSGLDTGFNVIINNSTGDRVTIKSNINNVQFHNYEFSPIPSSYKIDPDSAVRIVFDGSIRFYVLPFKPFKRNYVNHLDFTSITHSYSFTAGLSSSLFSLLPQSRVTNNADHIRLARPIVNFGASETSGFVLENGGYKYTGFTTRPFRVSFSCTYWIPTIREPVGSTGFPGLLVLAQVRTVNSATSYVFTPLCNIDSRGATTVNGQRSNSGTSIVNVSRDERLDIYLIENALKLAGVGIGLGPQKIGGILHFETLNLTVEEV